MTLHDTIDVRPDMLEAARTHGAVIDRPEIGWVVMRGADRLDLLQRLTTNDLAGVRVGTGKHTVLLTDKARIIDVLTVLHKEQETILVCSGGNGARVTSWLRNYIIMDDVKVVDRSADVEAMEWIGPSAPAFIHDAFGIDVARMPMAGFLDHSIDGIAATTIRIPATCELAYLTVIPRSADRPTGLTAAPLLNDAEDEYLRVMGGMGRSGAEWTDAYNPLEAGLLHMVSFAKGCYIGQEVVARLDSYNKVKQRIMGFVSDDAVQPGDVIIAESTEVGRITSAVPGISSARTYALGYIRHEHAIDGSMVSIRTSHGEVPATILQIPMAEA